jgi:hypothetical protein
MQLMLVLGSMFLRESLSFVDRWFLYIQMTFLALGRGKTVGNILVLEPFFVLCTISKLWKIAGYKHAIFLMSWHFEEWTWIILWARFSLAIYATCLGFCCLPLRFYLVLFSSFFVALLKHIQIQAHWDWELGLGSTLRRLDWKAFYVKSCVKIKEKRKFY